MNFRISKDWFTKRKKDSDRFEYEDPDYPDGGSFVGESLSDYHTRKWGELDPKIRERAVLLLKAEIAPSCLDEWRELMKADPEHWAAAHHFMAGMSFRNLLRKRIVDRELPTGNWDDYWVAALEAAVGIRLF